MTAESLRPGGDGPGRNGTSQRMDGVDNDLIAELVVDDHELKLICTKLNCTVYVLGY